MMSSSYFVTVDGARYEITPSFSNTTSGGLKRTSSELSYTIVPYSLEGFRSVPGTVAAADLAFRTYLKDYAPTDSSGNPFFDAEVREVEDSCGRVFEGTARFKEEERDQSSDVEFGVWPASFTTTGGSARMTRSYATRSYPINGTAPDFDNMIGWNGEEFDGVDAIVPAFSFELSRKTSEGFIDDFGSFAQEISNYVGTVNKYNFMGFKPGNVLFNGITSGSLQKQAATASEDAYNYWTLTYSFTASPTTTFTVGKTTIEKKGWEYLWYLTEKSFDQTTGLVVPVVRAAYVEQVYPYSDFAGLGLGYNW